jgi:magnesium chelatase family protein
MSLATVYTRARLGLEAPQVTCEVHLAGGLPGLIIVGLVETAVKESRERVRAAIKQSGFVFPDRKITVNLAPADLPKGGSRFDLAIAIGILVASGQVPGDRLDRHEFYGELAFSGALRAIDGVLPAVVKANENNHRCIVPTGCSAEVSLLQCAGTLLANHLIDVTRHLMGTAELADVKSCPVRTPVDVAHPPAADLADVHGQQQGRRALEIAATGGHHMLMVGPPGTGKTLLATRLPGLLPRLSPPQAIEVLLLYSLTPIKINRGRLQRPFRAPHHTATAAALVGGGRPPRPGEISLAHQGVLFLDELPEFTRNGLEALREPLESGSITIARADQTVRFPADFQLIAAMNPCVCGFHGDTQRECCCAPDQVRRYQNRISGPFLDRIDITLSLPRESITLTNDTDATPEDTAVVRKRVQASVEFRCRRSPVANARLNHKQVRQWCWPDRRGRDLLQQAAERFSLSLRACDRTLRVARTIADLERSERVKKQHVSESLAISRPGLKRTE